MRGSCRGTRLNVVGKPPATERHVSEILQSAAYAAGVPYSVFYLCGARQFEAAAAVGLARPAVAVAAEQPLLAAARAQDGPVLAGDGGRALDPRERMLLGPANGRLGFVAAVRVAFGRHQACGMLVLAAPAPPAGFGAAAAFVLRAHAAQISTLLALHELRGAQAGRAAELAGRATAIETELQEGRRVQARLRYVAFHDDLTMLHNRQFFMDRLAGAFARGTSEPQFRFAVLFMDLDRFKLVNDSFGHRSGDLLLIEVAERLRHCTRPSDVVARVGGDEFAVLVEGVEEMSFVGALAARIVEITRQPIRLGGQEIFSSCSVGVVQATRHYRLPEELLRDADLAMYRAKREEAGFTIFDDAMHNEAILKLQLHNDLHKAVARGELFVEYQPIFDAATRRVRGLEALPRWQHPRRGRLEPAEFLAAVEETELARQICAWLMREACGQMHVWRQQYPALDLWLGVNVSGFQLKDPHFPARLREVLASTKLAPAALRLEVPERAFGEAAGLDDAMAALRAHGVRIALDDFGSFAAAAGYLDCYQIDSIKLNRSFSIGMPLESKMAVATAMTTLARALGLEVVAEAIEDEAQLRALTVCGCDMVQGRWLAAPAAAEAVGRLLQHAAVLV